MESQFPQYLQEILDLRPGHKAYSDSAIFIVAALTTEAVSRQGSTAAL
jgi:hypothetical protein